MAFTNFDHIGEFKRLYRYYRYQVIQERKPSGSDINLNSKFKRATKLWSPTLVSGATELSNDFDINHQHQSFVK